MLFVVKNELKNISDVSYQHERPILRGESFLSSG